MKDLELQTILPAGCGAWDLTAYPFGGDFVRPRMDVVVSNVSELPGKPGWLKGECELPGRRGIRTIASDRFATDVTLLPGSAQ